VIRRTRIPWRKWRPKLFELLPYPSAALVPDLIAGVTVGFVALPLAMAFAISAGLPPQAGIYTAIVGGFLVSLLGGSKIQIGGPTGAFVVIIAGILAEYELSGLWMVTMMAGVILLFLGFTGLGTAVRYIPRPIVIGFTNGIALLIASTQLKDFLGLSIAEVPAEFLSRLSVIAFHLNTLNASAVVLAFASLAIILITPRLFPRIPGSILALTGATFAVYLLGLPVETIGSKFGGIPSGLPPIEIPAFRPDLILLLLPSALTVAILAAVESLLSAVVADSMIGDRHNSNAELIAQGAANLVVPMFGGIPVTGAIARTATNFRSGARTPLAGIVHSFTLLAVILVLAPLAKFVPLATLAAVLLVVAYNMGEWKEIPSILRLEMAEKSVWFITFVLTVLADLTVAVAVGMALAALLYIHRVAGTTTVSLVTPAYVEEGRAHSLQDHEIPSYVTVLRIHGPFLFGTAEQLTAQAEHLQNFARIVILRLRNMTAIDSTGLHALESFSEQLKASGRTLILCGARRQPGEFLHQSKFIQHIGAENIQPHIQGALARAASIRHTEPLQ